MEQENEFKKKRADTLKIGRMRNTLLFSILQNNNSLTDGEKQRYTAVLESINQQLDEIESEIKNARI